MSKFNTKESTVNARKPRFIVIENGMSSAGYNLVERREAHVLEHGNQENIKLLAKVTRSIDTSEVLFKVRKHGVEEEWTIVADMSGKALDEFFQDWEALWKPSVPQEEDMSPAMIVLMSLDPVLKRKPDTRKGKINGPRSLSSRPDTRTLPKGTAEDFSRSKKSVHEDLKSFHSHRETRGKSGSHKSRKSLAQDQTQRTNYKQDKTVHESRVKSSIRSSSSHSPTLLRNIHEKPESRQGQNDRKSRKSKGLDYPSEKKQSVQIERTQKEKSSQITGTSKHSSLSNHQKNQSGPQIALTDFLSSRENASGSAQKHKSISTMGELQEFLKREISRGQEAIAKEMAKKISENNCMHEERLQQISQNLHAYSKTNNSSGSMENPSNSTMTNKTKIGRDNTQCDRPRCLCQRYSMFNSSHRCPHEPAPQFGSRLEEDDRYFWLFQKPKQNGPMH